MSKYDSIPRGDMVDLGQDDKLPFFATHAGKTVSALLMVVIIIIILVMQIGSGGTIAYEMDENQLAVVCMDRSPVFIPFGTIIWTELVDTFQMGNMVEAAEWDAGWCGTYENEEYGVFTLYAYSDPGVYIVVKHENGVLIFNDRSQKATNAAYEELLERMG